MKLSERLEREGVHHRACAAGWESAKGKTECMCYLSAAIEQARRDEYDLARFCNPWTVQIKNKVTGAWIEHCGDAPVTLQNAEYRIENLKKYNPAAEFRAMPWLNSSQFQDHILPLRDHAGEMKMALESITQISHGAENGFAVAWEIATNALLGPNEALTGPTGGTQ